MKFSSLFVMALAVTCVFGLVQSAQARCNRCAFVAVSVNANCHTVVGTACQAGVCVPACDPGVVVPPPRPDEQPVDCESDTSNGKVACSSGTIVEPEPVIVDRSQTGPDKKPDVKQPQKPKPDEGDGDIITSGGEVANVAK